MSQRDNPDVQVEADPRTASDDVWTPEPVRSGIHLTEYTGGGYKFTALAPELDPDEAWMTSEAALNLEDKR